MSIRKYISLVSKLNEASESHQERLQRAKDMGFDVNDPHYFGTPNGDFDRLDLDRTSDDQLAFGRGAYTTRDPDAATGYSNPGSSWVVHFSNRYSVSNSISIGDLLFASKPTYNSMSRSVSRL